MQSCCSGVAQAACLWGNRASRLVSPAFSAGKMPAGPTAKMAVLLFQHEMNSMLGADLDESRHFRRLAINQSFPLFQYL